MRQSLRLSMAFMLLLVGTTEVLQRADAFSIPSPQSTSRVNNHLSSTLFQRSSHLEAAKNNNNGSFSLFKGRNNNQRLVSTKKMQFQMQATRLLGKIRRSALLFCASLLFWFGAAAMGTAPSHAEDAAAATPVPSAPQSRNIIPSTLDKIVDRYIKNHMFDDDVYDPVESTYREAVTDKIDGSHPRSISEIATSVLGQDGVRAEKSESSATGIGGILLNSINFLKRRGLSESAAILLLAGSFVFAGPIVFVTVGMMVGNQSKRQINSVMKKRYGDTYT